MAFILESWEEFHTAANIIPLKPYETIIYLNSYKALPVKMAANSFGLNLSWCPSVLVPDHMGLLFPIMSLVNTGATIPNTSQSSKRRCIHITLNLACLWVHQELPQRQKWPEYSQYEWCHGDHSTLSYCCTDISRQGNQPEEQKQKRPTDKPAGASLQQFH